MVVAPGPEIRTGKIAGGKEVSLTKGQTFRLECGQEIEGGSDRVWVQYANLPKVLKVGSRVLIDDGLIEMRVTALEDSVVVCEVLNPGSLGSTKVPASTLMLPAL